MKYLCSLIRDILASGLMFWLSLHAWHHGWKGTAVVAFAVAFLNIVSVGSNMEKHKA